MWLNVSNKCSQFVTTRIISFKFVFVSDTVVNVSLIIGFNAWVLSWPSFLSPYSPCLGLYLFYFHVVLALHQALLCWWTSIWSSSVVNVTSIRHSYFLSLIFMHGFIDFVPFRPYIWGCCSRATECSSACVVIMSGLWQNFRTLQSDILYRLLSSRCYHYRLRGSAADGVLWWVSERRRDI